MTDLTFWSARLSLLGLAVALGLIGWGLFGESEAWGRVQLGRYREHLHRQLRFLRSPVRAWSVIGMQLALGGLALVVACWSGWWLLLLVVPAVLAFPVVHIGSRAAKRISRFEDQIETWLSATSNALRASPSLAEAISSTVPIIPAPISEEVDILVKEYELGTPLDRALDNLAERIPSRTLSGSILALKVARKSGGDLSLMLDTAASALRELARLEGVLRTKTAEGRAQAFVIGVIPLPMVGLFHLMDPHFLAPLFSELKGHLVLFLVAILWVTAILLARKILSVDL